MFIQNVDRTKSKPNLLTNGKLYYLYDHEKAFTTARLIIPVPEPWIFSVSDINLLVKPHLFYMYIKKRVHQFDFNEFFSSFSSLNDNFWDKVRELIPAHWIDEQFNTITNCLKNVLLHMDIFKRQIREALA